MAYVKLVMFYLQTHKIPENLTILSQKQANSSFSLSLTHGRCKINFYQIEE
jgi:hypothetical protein